MRLWPLFGLRLLTRNLELRLPTEEEALRLVALAPDDLETDPTWPALPGSPSPVPTSVLQWYWRALGDWRAEHWRLPFAVWARGRLVGFQELEARRFSVLRNVETSSWLMPSTRGQGIGKEMRGAVLALAFDHLGAAMATTAAWEWNEASRSVSRSLGYLDNGWDMHEQPGGAGVMRRAVLQKSGWEGGHWPTTVEGLEPCRPWLGID